MEVVVKGCPKEGTSSLAAFIHLLLLRNNIPSSLDMSGTAPRNDATIEKLAREASRRLNQPVSVATEIQEAVPTERWTSRLTIDPDVSETSPIVKGTWVTVGQVVSHIIDGYTWKEILTTHPELDEDDIRACLRYSIEEDHLEISENECGKTDCGNYRQGETRPA